MDQSIRPVLDFQPREQTLARVGVQRLQTALHHRQLGLHGHRFFELIYLEAGAGHHRRLGRAIPVRAGDVMLIPPGQLHDLGGLEASGWIVFFEPDALGKPEALTALSDELLLTAFLCFTDPESEIGGHLHVPGPDRPAWTIRFQALERELQTPRPAGAEAVRALLTLLLVDTLRLATERLARLSQHSKPLLRQAFRVIETHFHEPISLADVARALGRSKAHLTTVVRRETGRSVLQWITERRLAEARRLLLETELPVERIAEAVGFGDPAHFTRQFRRRCGCAPLYWRRANRGLQRPAE